MLAYEAIVGTIALLFTAGNLYYQREAVRLMRASAVSPRQRAAMAAMSWWKSPQTAIMALLVVMAWTPWIYGLVYPATDDSAFAAEDYKWGALPDGEPYVSVILKDNKPERKIILVALHYHGFGDIKDQPGIQKSLPYDYVRGLNTFILDPDQSFRSETAAGQQAVSMMLLDVPNSVGRDQFSTIRQGIAVGAKIILMRAFTKMPTP